MNKTYWLVMASLLMSIMPSFALATTDFDSSSPSLDDIEAHPPIIVLPQSKDGSGFTPSQIKAAYNIPVKSGKGTIAIIDAYDDPTIEADLAVFDKKFGLSACTTANGCFEKYKIDPSVKPNNGWAEEIALDVEWAHAIAPKAKILLVETKTASLTNLLTGVDYVHDRNDVVAVSMSWGSNEFSKEASYDDRFITSGGATFFASSGDSGHGVSWPAVSNNVVGVGGTTLTLNSNGSVANEVAWSGSGGGSSKHESEPAFQATYNIAHAGGKRAVPDVSYNADPVTGYPVYSTTAPPGQKGWVVVGGTSAASPQWAALQSISSGITLNRLYSRAASSQYNAYFRDIVKGSNGSCAIFCAAGDRYDFVTGLGSPLKHSF